jgi:hypothetical protein
MTPLLAIATHHRDIVVRPFTIRLQKRVPADLRGAFGSCTTGDSCLPCGNRGGGGHFPLSQALGILVVRDMHGHCN